MAYFVEVSFSFVSPLAQVIIKASSPTSGIEKSLAVVMRPMCILLLQVDFF